MTLFCITTASFFAVLTLLQNMFACLDNALSQVNSDTRPSSELKCKIRLCNLKKYFKK